MPINAVTWSGIPLQNLVKELAGFGVISGILRLAKLLDIAVALNGVAIEFRAVRLSNQWYEPDRGRNKTDQEGTRDESRCSHYGTRTLCGESKPEIGV